MVRTTFSLSLALLLASCGGDEAPDYQIELTVSDVTLAASGTNGAEITVSVQDAVTGDPAPLLDVVLITCLDAASAPSGWIGLSDTLGQGQVPLDAVGLGRTTFRCSDDTGADYSVQCLGLYDGKTGFLPPLTCETDAVAE